MRGSRPTVGSSRNSTCGRESNDRAISSRRRCPPLYVSTLRSMRSARPKRSTMSAIVVRRRRLRHAPQPGVDLEIAPARERGVDHRFLEHDRARAPGADRVVDDVEAGDPSAVPPVGATVVVSIPIVVDFPAPFGPSKPNTSPGNTVKSMPATASTPPG